MKDLLSFGKYWSNKSNVKSTTSKFKITFLAIFSGLIFGFIVMAIMGYNPFSVISQLVTTSFRSPLMINTLLIFTAIYALAGFANAFAFKTGLFNIGVPGQMIAGGGTSMLLALTVFKSVSAAIAIPLLLIIAIAVACLVGLLVGVLKSSFNVHEVVSTILLNWVIFYIFKYIFRPGQSFVDQAGNSQYTNYSFYFGGNTNNAWVASIVIILVLSLSIFFVMKYTTFGRSIRMTGLNKDGAKYSGINTKFSTISALAISAAIAGILGFVYYFAKQHFVEKLTSTLPTYGFDGIAIALLAFNSPLMIPVISLMYAIFITGASGTDLPSSIQNETILLIFSIVIYFSAISNIFISFKPIRFLRNYILMRKNNEIKEALKSVQKLIYDIKNEEQANIDPIYQKMISLQEKSKSNKDNHKLKGEFEFTKNSYNNMKKSLNMRIKSLYKEHYTKSIKLIDDKTNSTIALNYGITRFYVYNFNSEIKAHIKAKYNFIIYEKMLEFRNQKNEIISQSNSKDEMKKLVSLKRNEYNQSKIDNRKKMSEEINLITTTNNNLYKEIRVEYDANRLSKKEFNTKLKSKLNLILKGGE